MVEFALVLPLLFSVMFIIFSVAAIEGVRIEEQKAAYDAARHLAKVAVSGNRASDNAEALRVIQFDYQQSMMLNVFTAGTAHVDSVDPGPIEGQNPESLRDYAVTVHTSYRLTNLPGWDFLGSLYGQQKSTLQETGVAAIVK